MIARRVTQLGANIGRDFFGFLVFICPPDVLRDSEHCCEYERVKKTVELFGFVEHCG